MILVDVSAAMFAIGSLGIFAAFRPQWEATPVPGPLSVRTGGGDMDERHATEVHRVHIRPWGRLAVGRTRSHVIRVGLAVLVGIVAGLVTGWIVAVPIGGLAALGLPTLIGRTRAEVTTAKIEAVATWTEMLQATLAASAGLSQAIVATAPLSPPAIRDATSRLAGLLEAGAQPREALLRFAEDVGDPSADRVVCALLLSYQSRGQRLGELLTTLADSTRDEVALRLRIETSRSSVRSSVRVVLFFSVGFAAGLVLLARSYLSPLGTPSGQVVLLFISLLYAAGLSMMVALARPPAPVRLLGRHVVVQ